MNLSPLKELFLGKPKSKPVIPSDKLGITVTLTPQKGYGNAIIWEASASYGNNIYRARSSDKGEAVGAVRDAIKKQMRFESVKSETLQI